MKSTVSIRSLSTTNDRNGNSRRLWLITAHVGFFFDEPLPPSNRNGTMSVFEYVVNQNSLGRGALPEWVRVRVDQWNLVAPQSLGDASIAITPGEYRRLNRFAGGCYAGVLNSDWYVCSADVDPDNAQSIWTRSRQ